MPNNYAKFTIEFCRNPWNSIENHETRKKFESFDKTFSPNLLKKLNFNSLFHLEDYTYQDFEKRVLFLLEDANTTHFCTVVDAAIAAATIAGVT